MTDFTDLSKIVGVFDASLLISIVVVWREWRKAEAKIIELLQKQIETAGANVEKFHAFENVIRSLADVMKKG